ncbi:hypothetical protein ACFQI7_27440 [Paenibacillus allorhizosphaerae]|uniref:Type II secretion system protein GspF domain-containing protein n=1 Tax=Paenibacillus allorhizosphaerae TaxID=2849866 RepID=A0ABM8VNK7_9BACL|nr:hypothetical protein [Paenibacillus allorhizosphaerae]CAG7651322.1 hypothetical protein PAECIP111802_04934 [Paenibacillus allorhizosphaerae]
MDFWNYFWNYGFKAILVICFAAGALFFWLPIVSSIRFTRNSRLARLLEELRSKEEAQSFYQSLADLDDMPAKVRQYYERARLADLPHTLTYTWFQFIRWILASIFMLFAFMSQVRSLNDLLNLNLGTNLFLLLFLVSAGLLGYWLPMVIVVVYANGKKTEYLIEIAKLSQRLQLCVNEKSDIRETFLMASRPLKLLKPHIQEMAAAWGNNQRAAIERFKDSVGISEIYPLVNALISLSETEAKEIVEVLKSEAENIDATLESDVNRSIENAPIFISFYIMIPFGIDVILFLYPWLTSISTQIMTSFTMP